MDTEQLVDELIALNAGWNRDGDHGVLKYLNQAHRILMSAEAELTLITDETTGKLPTFDTTAETYVYTMPSNVRRVAAVYILSSSSPISNKDYGRQLPYSDQNTRIINGERYTRIWCAKGTTRINSSTLSKVTFSRDPGSTTGYYYYEAYKVPTDISSENIAVDVPEPYDFHYLVPAASKLIEAMQNYTLAEVVSYIQTVMRPAMWKEINAGDQGSWDSEPVDRGF